MPQMPRQLELPFGGRGAAPDDLRSVETSTAGKVYETPGGGVLMARVVHPSNIWRAYHRVKANQGSPGPDGMTVTALGQYLSNHLEALQAQLLAGTYKPQGVRLVELPKPGGGVRILGIPSVVDRVIQTAIVNVISPIFDQDFSQHSYGYRRGKTALMAIKSVQAYAQGGHDVVVDIDLEKFFDRVNHDVLMSRVARKVKDKAVLKVIRAYLEAGHMYRGVAVKRRKGTAQGGPLSPLLANLLLDEVDQKLEAAGHRFARYADDLIILVKSHRAGQRVFERVKKWLGKLRLKVNESKSAVARLTRRTFLGYGFYKRKGVIRRTISKASTKRFKAEVRRRTRRVTGRSLVRVIKALVPYLRGWGTYYKENQTPSKLVKLDRWVRRRLRAIVLKQWKTAPNARKKLKKLGADEKQVKIITALMSHVWSASKLRVLNQVLDQDWFRRQGLLFLADLK